MSNTYSKISRRHVAAVVIPALILVTLVAGQAWLGQSERTVPPAETALTDTQAKDVITYAANGTQTALAQLKSLNDSVVTKDSEFGSYVHAINGLEGGTDGKYWSFYVNEKMAAEGAGAVTPAEGDKVEWKFQKL